MYFYKISQKFSALKLHNDLAVHRESKNLKNYQQGPGHCSMHLLLLKAFMCFVTKSYPLLYHLLNNSSGIIYWGHSIKVDGTMHTQYTVDS